MNEEALKELFLFARDHPDVLFERGFKLAGNLGYALDGVSSPSTGADPGTAAIDIELLDGSRYYVSAVPDDV